LQLVSNERQAYQFALEHRIVDNTLTCDCGSKMALISDASRATGFVFKCTAGKSSCLKRKSALYGSWLANSHLGIQRSLVIIAGYAAELDYAQMRFFVEIGSDSTISNWRNYFRDICAEESLGFHFKKIGGPNTTVEIDESFVFRRKNHVGRLLTGEREHIWVLGGICRETRQPFAVTVPNRTASTLQDLIQEYVLPGTIIITDGWRGYLGLQAFGYIHKTVNHSENFVNPNDRTVYTNTIERQWGILKQIIPNQTHQDLRYTYLAEYIWKVKNRWFNITIGERINLILLSLKNITFNN
jgi:hypothetical protein